MYEEAKNDLQQIFQKFSLTQREIEIVAKVVEGHGNKKIGELPYIEEYTVKQHLKNIFKKLNIQKRTELIAISFEKTKNTP